MEIIWINRRRCGGGGEVVERVEIEPAIIEVIRVRICHGDDDERWEKLENGWLARIGLIYTQKGERERTKS